ncbi:MAG: hypothetical protein ACLQVF_35360 [Isosphaeraceae bacterium]
MLRARVFFMVAVAGLLSVSAACRKPSAPGPAPNTPASTGLTSAPRIWPDTETTDITKLMATLLGPGSDINVYRWENGFVEGWVQFDGDGSPNRIPLDYQRHLVNQMSDEMGVEVPEASWLSGMAIVGRTKVNQAGPDGGGYDWYECKLVIQTKWAGPDRTSIQSIGPVSGRLKVARSEGQQSSFSTDQSEPTVCRFRKPRIKVPDAPIWMELKVITPTREEGK